MPVVKPGLTDTFLKNLKNNFQQKKFSDGGGLYIYLRDSGAKLWQMSYRFNGKQKILSFGEYPYVSLKQAREKREAAKTMLAAGTDPGALKKADKQAEIAKTENMKLLPENGLPKTSITGRKPTVEGFYSALKITCSHLLVIKTSIL